MKKTLALILALAMMLSLAACGGKDNASSDNGSSTENTQSTTPAVETAGPSSIAVCIASEPDTLDPALNSSVDGATMLVHLFSGLAKWTQDESGAFHIVADAATELTEPVANDDGTVTYTYTLRDGMAWSDGQPVTAADFEYAWQRASNVELGSDYGYMFDVVKGYSEEDPAARLAVEAKDEKTLEVTLNGPVSYWNELLAFPVYFPVREDVVANEAWATDPSTYVCNGAYTMSDWSHNSVITLAKNENYADADEVTLNGPVSYWNELLAFPVYFPVREDVVANEAWATDPSTFVCNGAYTMSDWAHNSVITLQKNPNYADADEVTMDTIEFYLSDDANNMLSNFQNGSWLLIDDVPTNEIANLKAQYPDEFVVAGQIGTYYVCWNINEDILPADSGLTGVEAENAKAEIRKAIGLLYDRNYIVEEIGQAGQVPASSFVAMGMTNPDGTQFYQTAGHNDGFVGYYDVSADAIESNYASAIETLKKYYNFDEATQQFTNFPTLTYLYNTSEAHKAIGEYLQSAMAGVGLNMNLDNQEWATFLNTRKQGNYSIARNGWLADYNDPICFLDMWTTVSGNNDVQFGKGAHKDVAAYSMDLTPYGYDVKVENGTWAETYDVLISTIKSCADENTRFELMHLAEDLLMSTGCIVPLYFYTDIYMLSNRVSGFFSNPLGYKYFMYTTVA